MVRTFVIFLFWAFLLIPLHTFSEDTDSSATPVSTMVGTAGGNPGWR